MLDVKELSVSYGKRIVLDHISFSLEKGSVTALLGLNGTGKSTLLSALSGALAVQGEVRWEGVSLAALPPRERAKKLAFLPQAMPTPPFTVAEAVLCGRYPYMTLAQRPRQEDVRIAEEMMEKTGIAHLRARRLSSVSGGERQMTLLAMVLAQKTPFLLLDEPTSFLDKAKEKRFWDTLLRAQREEGITVLAAMHDLTAAVRVAHRFLILSEAGLIFRGTREALLASSCLEDTFGVRRYDTADGPVFV